MIFLPIVERELRVAARRRSAFWIRLVGAGGGVVCGFGVLSVDPPWAAPAVSGGTLLSALTWLVFCICLAAGPALTADLLSSERREGTLGLLFLTDLRGLDVVLGKAVAASVAAVFGLLAVLPVMAVSILLGGVQPIELIRIALVLLNTLFLSLATGLLMSACCKQGRSALALTGFALFVLVVTATWLAQELGFGPYGSTGALVASVFSPVCALDLARSANYRTAASAFWFSLGVMHGLGWCALTGASWLTQRVWREPSGWLARVGQRRFWHDWYYGSPAERRRRRPLLEQNPIAWLGWRHQLKRQLLWGTVGMSLAFWVFFRWRYPHFADSGTAVFLVGLWLLGPLKWLATSEASYRLVADLQTGAMELLLTTPLTVQDILRGQLRSMDRLFLWPAAVVVAVQTVMLLLIPDQTHADTTIVGLAIVGVIMALWDLRTLAWVGMWLGMTLQRPDRALAGAVLRVLVLPWLILFAALIGSAAMLGPTGRTPAIWDNIPYFWFLVCATANLGFGLTARHRLKEHFRSYAAERYTKTA